MTQQSLAQRPTSEAALAKFNGLVKAQSSIALRWRLQSLDEARGDRFKADTGYAIRELEYLVQYLLCEQSSLTMTCLNIHDI
jgi:hypothetical protein